MPLNPVVDWAIEWRTSKPTKEKKGKEILPNPAKDANGSCDAESRLVRGENDKDISVEESGPTPLPDLDWGCFGGAKPRNKKAKRAMKATEDAKSGHAEEEAARDPIDTIEPAPESKTKEDTLNQLFPFLADEPGHIWGFPVRPKNAKKVKHTAEAASKLQDPAVEDVPKPIIADSVTTQTAQSLPVANATTTTLDNPAAMNAALNDLAKELEAKAKLLRTMEYREGADRILKKVKGDVVKMRNRIREMEAKEKEGGAKVMEGEVKRELSWG